MQLKSGLSVIAVLALSGLSVQAPAQLVSPGAILKQSKVRVPKPEPATSNTAASPAAAPAGAFSAMHQAHLGKVVFTRIDLERDRITEASLASTFTLGDPIFFRVYMREPTAAHLAPKLPGKTPYWVSRSVRYKARFTVAGQVIDTHFRIWGKAGDHETWTTWRGELLSRADKFQPGSEVFREFLSRATQRGLMGVGTHQIKLEIIPYSINIDGDVNYNGSSNEPPVAMGEVIATGELALTVKPGSYAKSDPKICAPAAAPSNPALNSRFSAAPARNGPGQRLRQCGSG
jgi:hypothetical protein